MYCLYDRRLGFLNDTFECDSTNNEDLVDCLRAYDAKELDNRAFLTALAQDYSLDWSVVIDGYFTDQVSVYQIYVMCRY